MEAPGCRPPLKLKEVKPARLKRTERQRGTANFHGVNRGEPFTSFPVPVIIVIVNVRGFAGFLNREICFDASGLKFGLRVAILLTGWRVFSKLGVAKRI